MIITTEIITADIRPFVPENVIGTDDALIDKLRGGVTISMNAERIDPSTALRKYSPPQDILRKFRDKNDGTILLPLWALAHLYIKSYVARDLLDTSWNMTSTAREVNREKGLAYIAHQVMLRNGDYARDNGTLVDRTNYGLVIPVSLDHFPIKDVGLKEFVRGYPQAAQSLLLMDENQLEEFIKKQPSNFFRNEFRGYNRDEGISHLAFGARSGLHSAAPRIEMEGYGFYSSVAQPGRIYKP